MKKLDKYELVGAALGVVFGLVSSSMIIYYTGSSCMNDEMCCKRIMFWGFPEDANPFCKFDRQGKRL